MHAESVWIENTRSVLTNKRQHSMIVDLPENYGGEDLGATSMELVIMAIPGCVTTIFAMLAKKKELCIHALECSVEASEENTTGIPTQVTGIVKVETNNEDLAEEIWKQTQHACPVVKMMQLAGTKVEIMLQVTPYDKVEQIYNRI